MFSNTGENMSHMREIEQQKTDKEVLKKFTNEAVNIFLEPLNVVSILKALTLKVYPVLTL